MRFAPEMLDTKRQLEELGHSVEIPCDTELHVSDPALKYDIERDTLHAVENNVMHKCFELVAKSDAVLVLNHRNKEIDGYIGASALMETGLAAYLKKNIFVLHPIDAGQPYTQEIAVLGGVILNGDIKKIPVL